MPHRRSVLAAVSSLVGAGCLGPVGGPGSNDTPGRASPHDSSTSDGQSNEPRNQDGCSAGYDVRADPFDPAADLTLRLDEAQRSLVAEAVETGEAELRQYGDRPPVDDGAYVDYGGSYYETASTRVGSTDVSAVLTNVEWERGQEAPEVAEVVAYADLPGVDRAAVRYAVYGKRSGGERSGDERRTEHPQESLSVREAPVPYPEGTDDSLLVDGETWVQWDDRTYRVWTGGETTTTRYRFRITVSKIADGPDAFRALVAERHLLELSGLSDAERSVLRGAADGGYEACSSDAGVTNLRERLSKDERLPPPRNSAWYVQFEESRYVLNINRWVH